jgi:hypothetical protein
VPNLEDENKRIGALQNYIFRKHKLLMRLDDKCKCGKKHPDAVLTNNEGDIIFVEITSLVEGQIKEKEKFYRKNVRGQKHSDIDLSKNKKNISIQEIDFINNSQNSERITNYDIPNAKIDKSVRLFEEGYNYGENIPDSYFELLKPKLVKTITEAENKFKDCKVCLQKLNQNLCIKSVSNVLYLDLFGIVTYPPQKRFTTIVKEIVRSIGLNINFVYGSSDFLFGLGGKIQIAGDGNNPDSVPFRIYPEEEWTFCPN